jgi:hypothetical protein
MKGFVVSRRIQDAQAISKKLAVEYNGRSLNRPEGASSPLSSPLSRGARPPHLSSRMDFEEDESETIEGLMDEKGVQEDAENLMKNMALSRPHRKWEKLVTVLLKQNCWNMLGDFAKALSKLPDDVLVIFQAHEKATGIKLDETQRLRFYKEYVRSAHGGTMLRFEEVISHTAFGIFEHAALRCNHFELLIADVRTPQLESLVLRLRIAGHLSRPDLRTLLSSKLEESVQAGTADGPVHPRRPHDSPPFSSCHGLLVPPSLLVSRSAWRSFVALAFPKRHVSHSGSSLTQRHVHTVKTPLHLLHILSATPPSAVVPSGLGRYSAWTLRTYRQTIKRHLIGWRR